MFSKEFLSIVINVISSWQVIIVTIVIILYVSLVSYAAQSYRRPRSASVFKPKAKKKKIDTHVSDTPEIFADDTINDELGLE
jgi:hypothetical protein